MVLEGYEERFVLTLPDPYDPDPGSTWHQLESFDTEAEAIAFIREHLGGDAKGRIGLISHPPDVDEGWLVDLPHPLAPDGPWVFVESFPTKREAISFVREKYGANTRGEIKVIESVYATDEEEEERRKGFGPTRGPRDWSPRWDKEKKGRKKK